jgi:hypothetical protein
MFRIFLNDWVYFSTRLLTAVGTATYQCLLWADGSLEVLGTDLFFKLLLNSNNSFVQWLNHPNSWPVLHRFVTLTPVPVFLFLVAWSLERSAR